MPFAKFLATANLVEPTTIVSPNAASITTTTKYRPKSAASRTKRQLESDFSLIDTLRKRCPDENMQDLSGACRPSIPHW